MTNRRSRWLSSWVIAGALSAASYPAFAQFVPTEPYREYFDPTNPVKGEALVGLAVKPASDSAQLDDKVWVLVGKDMDVPQTVTVEAASASGSFRGTGSFTGTAKSGWTSLDLVDTLREDNRKRPADPETLAIAVRGEKPNQYRIVAWGKDEPSLTGNRVLRFYVNSRRGTMSIRSGKTTRECQRHDSPRSVRFDVYCDFEEELIEDDTVQLIRRDGFNVESQRIEILR